MNNPMIHETVRLMAAMFWGSIILLSVIDVMYKYSMHETTLKYQAMQGDCHD